MKSEKSKTGINVKANKLLGRKVKLDFKKILTTLSKSAIMYYAGKPENVAKESVSFINGFGFSTDTSDLAYQLIMTALVNSAHHLARENAHRFVARFEDHEKLYDDKEYMEFLEGITALVEEEEVVIEYETLLNPRSLPLLKSFQQYFYNYLILFGIPEKEAELIRNRLPAYFVFELNDEWRNNFTKYEPIMQKLDAPTAEAARKERQREAYYSYLEREVEMPVFGESFSLRDIFIPLRAYFENKVKIDKVVVNQNFAIWLDEHLDKWLSSTDEKEPTIKVIEGGPGSGKSSFAKYWTAKLAREKRFVLFFPLHHFNIHNNIRSAIGEYFKNSPDIPLDYNPFDDAKAIDKMLLVFDGLDELVMQGKSSNESATAFMQELKDFSNQFNAKKNRVKILVTGRPIAIQSTETKLRESNDQIIHLLPYYLTEEQSLNYHDTSGCLNEDQRNQWWNKFFTCKGLSNHNLPEELRNDNMDSITREPLLNYLVALSWKDAPHKFNKETNINDIYNQLILGVYKREYAPDREHKAIGDLREDQFIKVLEEIAICAWHGGDVRVTTERRIERHIESRGLKPLLDKYKNAVKGGVSRLLTAFYFRKFGKDEVVDTKDDTFEFTHKTFGEYLIARAIVGLVKSIDINIKKHKNNTDFNVSEGWTTEQALSEWFKVAGSTALNEDLNKFIINEIRIREKEGEAIEEWQNTLSELVSQVASNGMPIHLRERTLFLKEREQTRNAEESLMVLMSSCAIITNQLSSVKWKTPIDFNTWLPRLSSNSSNFDLVYSYLNDMDLGGVVLVGANLKRANLEGTNLEGTNLQGANLAGANLEGANLRGADLELANLKEADLGKANLQGVGLERANLEIANLAGADLERADLELANLKEADLERANLKEVGLEGANLEEANLRGANLESASLKYANLRGANLESANMKEAYLPEADLRGANLEEADLELANLRGADLEEVVLDGVNLQEADLGGAKHLTFEQLILAKSLYQIRGISIKIKEQLKKEKPELFQKPKL